jgi:outer membrane protein TolC
VLSLYYRDAQGSPVIVDASATPAELPLPPPLATNAEADEASIACNPAVARKRAQLAQARIARDLARAQRAPRLDATFQVSRDFGDGSETQGGTVLEGGVVLSMPLGMRTPRGRLDSADAQVEAIEQELRLIEDQLRMERQNAISQERNAREQYELATALLDNTQRLAEAERSRFEAGSTSLFVVNLREQALGEAAIAQVDAARELWSVQALWQAITACEVD